MSKEDKIQLIKEFKLLNTECYNEIIKDKSQEEIENINNDIIAKCTKVINNDNEKFYDEKNKIYEKFKSLYMYR